MMIQDPRKIKAFLRPELFWDVDFSNLDLDAHAAFVITRVMERGTRQEARAVWNYFGEETIKNHLTAARYLSPKTISYFAIILKIDPTKFQSYSIQNRVRTWP